MNSEIERNLGEQPVEVNLAEKKELMRVPGIGPKMAQAILEARPDHAGARPQTA